MLLIFSQVSDDCFFPILIAVLTNLPTRIPRSSVYVFYAEEAAHPEFPDLSLFEELCTFFPNHAELVVSLD
jgi:hypothetical protein